MPELLLKEIEVLPAEEPLKRGLPWPLLLSLDRLKSLCLVSILLFFFLLPSVPLAASYSKEAMLHYEKGISYAKDGYADLAIKEFEEAVKMEPHVAEGHRLLGFAYTTKWALNKAVQEYETALGIDPAMANAPAMNLHWLEVSRELLKDFMEELHKIAKDRPDHPMPHALLGWLYGETGKLSQAVKELNLTVELKPSLGKGYLDGEDKTMASLMWEAVTALQNNPGLAKTQVQLILFTLKNK